MARVSRKSVKETKKQDFLTAHIYQTAIYVRLSVEDNHHIDNQESILMQRYMLEQYVDLQVDMQLSGVFCDNGETGTNFERPGFEEMMEQIRKRKIDCIVVKDLSRFGRNYIEAGYYLEKIFPYLGVRFVAVSDRYDTLDGTKGDELITSLKNLVNDWYAKDISQKIGSALLTKQKKGEFIGAIPPYGYIKSVADKHKLMIDREVASVVKDIFRWRLEGQGWVQIAQRLNRMGIPSPAMYHYQKGHKKKKPSKTSAVWQAQGVKTLVQNPVYAGHMVQGKWKTSLSEGITRRMIEQKDWIVVEQTHPAIIDPEIFGRVQEIARQRYNKGNTGGKKENLTENHLKGLLFCADCGAKMIRDKKVSSGMVRYDFFCRMEHGNLDGWGCRKIHIEEVVLKQIIFQGLRIQLEWNRGVEKLFSLFWAQFELQKQIEKRAEDRIQQKSRIKSRALFERYSNGVITEAEYLVAKTQYRKEIEEQLSKLEQRKQAISSSFSLQNQWITAVKEKKSEFVMTRKVITELVQRVWVLEGDRIEIVWNFRDEIVRSIEGDCGSDTGGIG